MIAHPLMNILFGSCPLNDERTFGGFENWVKYAMANALVSHTGESVIMETGTHPSAFVTQAGRIRMTSLYMACVQ